MSRELLEDMLDYAVDLQCAWGWKKGERAGNAKEYDDLCSFIAQIRVELAKPDHEPLSEDKISYMWNRNRTILEFARDVEKAHGIGE
jgi:hypothetical protein